MPIEGQFMPVVVKTRTALRRIPRILYPRKHLLHIILNIPLDNIHLYYIFPTVIILNISYLRIFIFLLHQIIQMVCLHLFYDLHQSVVECCCQIHLSVVLLFEIWEFLYVWGLFWNHRVAEFQDVHYLVVYWLLLELRQVGKRIFLAQFHPFFSRHFKLLHSAALGDQLSCTSLAEVFLSIFSLNPKLCFFARMVAAHQNIFGIQQSTGGPGRFLEIGFLPGQMVEHQGFLGLLMLGRDERLR